MSLSERNSLWADIETQHTDFIPLKWVFLMIRVITPTSLSDEEACYYNYISCDTNSIVKVICNLKPASRFPL